MMRVKIEKHPKSAETDHMSVVFVGHVDHGKSTVIGRLLADTYALPKGKLEALMDDCSRQGKQFEYAFLIDALKDERAQNITIDTARIFFKSEYRSYLIFDAPGHIEFIKNMVTGASHAEAAVLVIDAQEGIKENSRRHGFLLSLLGISRIIVAINKMDLVAYDQDVFKQLTEEYSNFLKSINVEPDLFIPVSAYQGDSVVVRSQAMGWYHGPTLLEGLDSLKKTESVRGQPLRLPIQAVYKFSGNSEQQRIVAGTVSSGFLAEGDCLVAFPSGKMTHVNKLVGFNKKYGRQAAAGEAVGFTMTEQVYLRRGEIICQMKEKAPIVSSRLKASVFWVGKKPLEKGKKYLFKLGTAKETGIVENVHAVMDGTTYTKRTGSDSVKFHEVAEVSITLNHPIAFDTSDISTDTSRFVIVDGYAISGGGIVREGLYDEGSQYLPEVFERERKWIRSNLTVEQRAARFEQKPSLIVITGEKGAGRKRLASALEKELNNQGKLVYYLGIGSVLYGVNADLMRQRDPANWPEHLRRFAEVCHLLLDTGMVLIITVVELNAEDINTINAIIDSHEVLTVWLGRAVTNTLLPDLVLDPVQDPNIHIELILYELESKGWLGNN